MDIEKGAAAVARAGPRPAAIAHLRLRPAQRQRHEPSTKPAGALWTVVNEYHDELDNDLRLTIFTSVKDSSFYGWPYGSKRDRRHARQTANTDGGYHSHSRLCAGRPRPRWALLIMPAKSCPDRFQGGHVHRDARVNRNRRGVQRLQGSVRTFQGQSAVWRADRCADRLPQNRRQRQVAWAPRRRGHGRMGALLVADDTSNIVWRVTRDQRQSQTDNVLDS